MSTDVSLSLIAVLWVAVVVAHYGLAIQIRAIFLPATRDRDAKEAFRRYTELTFKAHAAVWGAVAGSVAGAVLAVDVSMFKLVIAGFLCPLAAGTAGYAMAKRHPEMLEGDFAPADIVVTTLVNAASFLLPAALVITVREGVTLSLTPSWVSATCAAAALAGKCIAALRGKKE